MNEINFPNADASKVRPRVHRSGPRDWKVLVFESIDAFGRIRLQTHSTHATKRQAIKACKTIGG